MISVKLDTCKLEYKAKGETVLEALNNLGLDWQKVKAKGVITVTKGKNSLEHLFVLRQMKRIFANKYYRQLWAKRLELLFSNKFNEK